jgi:hypothetical protein
MSTGVTVKLFEMVAMLGLVVLIWAFAPFGTPADQLAAVFQSVLVLPFQVLCAGLVTGRASKLNKRLADAKQFIFERTFNMVWVWLGVLVGCSTCGAYG